MAILLQFLLQIGIRQLQVHTPVCIPAVIDSCSEVPVPGGHLLFVSNQGPVVDLTSATADFILIEVIVAQIKAQARLG